MKKKGNTIVNKEYNPRNVKPDIPVDVDEADSAMERFIRQKYEHRILEDGKPKPPSRDDSGYHTQKSLDESPPPPLPPKSGRKFGFGLRSVSSTSRLPRHSDKPSLSLSSPRSATHGGPLSPSLNKQSRVFGANLGETDTSFEAKLDQLRSMGFPNDKRNASVLKGVGGDMTRAVESLIRLGEGGGSQLAVPPKPTTSASLPDAAAARAEADDPWSIPSNVHSSAGAQISAAPSKPYNPFDIPNTQNSVTTGLESAFQNMQVAQPMSPHTTGGYVSHQMANNMSLTPLHTSYTSHSYTNSPQPLGYNPFFQTASPTGQSGNPYFGSQTAQSTPVQPTRSFSPGNPFANSLSAQSTGNQQNLNAALQSQRFAMPRHANTMPAFSSSPYPATAASVFQPQPQQPQQAQQLQQLQQLQLNPYQASSINPFDAANMNNNQNNYTTNFQQSQYQEFQQQNPYAQYQQTTAQQQPARADKNSILALYNLAPAAAPPMSTIPEQTQVPQMQPAVGQYQGITQNPSNAPAGYAATQTMHTQPTQNGASMGLQNNVTGSVQAGQSMNPFMNMNNGAQQQQQQLQQQQIPQPQQSHTNPFSMMAPQSTTSAATGQSNGLGIGLGSGSTAPALANNPYMQMATQQSMASTQGNNFMSRVPMHMSKASVDINNLQNGRHSPDAFASLSARFA